MVLVKQIGSGIILGCCHIHPWYGRSIYYRKGVPQMCWGASLCGENPPLTPLSSDSISVCLKNIVLLLPSKQKPRFVQILITFYSFCLGSLHWESTVVISLIFTLRRHVVKRSAALHAFSCSEVLTTPSCGQMESIHTFDLCLTVQVVSSNLVYQLIEFTCEIMPF